MARIPLQAYSLEPTGADKPTALPPQHFYLFLCSHQCTFLASPLGLIELLTVQSQTQLTGQEVGPLDTQHQVWKTGIGCNFTWNLG